MEVKRYLLIAFLGLAFFSALLCLPSPTSAQNGTATPQATATPQSGQQQAAMSFADTLRNFQSEAIVARQLFINSVEKPLGGWVMAVAQMLALIMFSWAIAQGLLQGGFSGGDLYRIAMRCAVGFLLLFFAGDVDGDGIRGDLINYPASVGYYYAYGVSKEGQVEGSFLNKRTTEQEAKFNEQYQKFVENKFMVKVSGRDIPVQYPTTQDYNLLAALYTGKPLNQDEIDKAKSRETQMSWLFAIFNFGRGLMSFADFFIFFISGFAVVVLRLALPLMIGVMFHKDYGQKITTGFFWTAFVWTLIFPGMCQFIRLLAYSGGNLAMGLGGSNPYYAWDATQGKIIATGNPEIVIILAAAYMIVSGLCLFAAFFISMYLSQGKILEGFISTTSAWFTAATSIGMGVATGAAASRFNMEADQVSAKGARDSAMAEAGFAKTSSEISARASNEANKVLADSSKNASLVQANASKRAEDISAEAQYQAAGIGAFSSLVGSYANAKIEAGQSRANAVMNYRQEWMNLDSKEKQERLTNSLDFAAKNNDAYAKEIQEAIKASPEAKELIGKQIDGYLNGIPIAGSALKTVGLNGDAVNTWLGSDSGKRMLAGMVVTPAGMLGAVDSRPTQFLSDVSGLSSINSADGLQGIFSKDTLSKITAEDVTKAQNGISFSQPQQNSGATIYTSRGGGGLTKSQAGTAGILNDEMMKLGYTPQARQVLLGEFGREHGFNRSVISQGHWDDANGKRNVGIISWQGDRNDRLAASMKKQGFLNSNGTLVDSEPSLRAQVRFLDSELKNGGKGWQITGEMLRNPQYSQSNIAARMGGKSGYIGYNNTNPKYKNAGDPVFASPNTGSWARRSSGIVIGSVNKDMERISKMDIARAKVEAPIVSRKFERDFQLSQNRMNYEGKEQIAGEFYQEQRGIAQVKLNDSVQIADTVQSMRESEANRVYGDTMRGAQVTRAGSHNAAQVRQQGAYQAAEITQGGQYRSADINMQAQLESARLAYEGRRMSTDIQYESALKSSHLRALGSMFQTIGNSAGHHIAEATEKFSRV